MIQVREMLSAAILFSIEHFFLLITTLEYYNPLQRII